MKKDSCECGEEKHELFGSACAVVILVNLQCWFLTYPHSSPPRDSGGQTWQCSGCTRRSVWTEWASVSAGKNKWYVFSVIRFAGSYRCLGAKTNKRVLPNRCCRICSDPGCLSLQAPQLSGEVKKKRERERENENPRNSSLALQHKTKLRLKAHTGSLADSQWIGTKACMNWRSQFNFNAFLFTAQFLR